MSAGLRKTPSRFPNAELKIEEASSPPAALVKTTHMLIVRGKQEVITIPSAKIELMMLYLDNNLLIPKTIDESTRKLKPVTKELKEHL
mmetsp:Transcript_3918/g.8435  ORF Transcript_3918/g.8435 Transcript_3918/m.8435 type:complete len:88 (-) Transcript_3918:743-1006(-)